MTVFLNPVDQIPYAELLQHRVWEYVDEPTEEQDETWAYPVSDLPVTSLENRLASCAIRLSNGQMIHALLSNLDLDNPSNTRHFLAVSVVTSDGERFHLARYHDPHYLESGPDALSAFLGLPHTDVFPISFDISGFAVGRTESVTGVIPYEPTARLSRRELIGLAAG